MAAATPVSKSARDRARQEITEEILRVARDHLARDGAAALSLRAVARDVGMVSSAVYRYVPNREALLTLLIIEAYDSLGDAVERVDSKLARHHFTERFLATAHAVRDWALANPHQYALVYGSPVPGYSAPDDTIAPASRVPFVLLSIIRDSPRVASKNELSNDALASALKPLRNLAGVGINDELLCAGLSAWATLLGWISLELFGHLHNVVAEPKPKRRALFDHQMRAVAADLENLIG